MNIIETLFILATKLVDDTEAPAFLSELPAATGRPPSANEGTTEIQGWIRRPRELPAGSNGPGEAEVTEEEVMVDGCDGADHHGSHKRSEAD